MTAAVDERERNLRKATREAILSREPSGNQRLEQVLASPI
jgi:hypothetical protein